MTTASTITAPLAMDDHPAILLPHQAATKGWALGSADAPRTKDGGAVPFDLAALPLRDLLTRRWQTDAHAFGVCLTNEDGAPEVRDLPRPTTHALAQLDGTGVGAFLTAAFLDLDGDAHSAWPDQATAYEGAELLCRLFPEAYAVYTTNSGARLVFVPEHPIPALGSRHQPWVKGLCALVQERLPPDLAGHKVTVDPASWSRVRAFRLPYTARKDKPTRFPPFLQILGHTVPLAFVDVGKAPQGPTIETLHVDERDTPDVGEPVPSRDPLWMLAGLMGWAVVEDLPTSGEPLPLGHGMKYSVSPGRHSLLVDMAGTAVGRLARARHDDPAMDVWGLLAPLAQAAEDDGSKVTVDWLWGLLKEFAQRSITEPVPSKATGRYAVVRTGDEHVDSETVCKAVIAFYEDTLYRVEGGLLAIGADGEPEHFASTSAGQCPVAFRNRITAAATFPDPEGNPQTPPATLTSAAFAKLCRSPALDEPLTVERMPPLDLDGRLRHTEGLCDGRVYVPTAGVAFPDPMSADEGVAAWSGLLEGYLAYRPGSGFLEPEDYAAYLAWGLGALLRPALHTQPMLVINANMAGAGKTNLLDVLALVMEGRRDDARLPTDDHQANLLLRAWAAGRRRFLWLDNVRYELGGPALDAALTGSNLAGRELHTTAARSAPFICSVAVSANNLAVLGDTKRRTLMVRLHRDKSWVPPTHFDVSAFRQRILAQRGRLYVALASIYAGYVAAGRPSTGRRYLPSFEQWDRTAADAVHWATGTDPTRYRQEAVEAGDVRVEAVGLYLRALHAQIRNERRKGSEVLNLLAHSLDMRTALRTLQPERGEPSSWTARTLNSVHDDILDEPVDGLVLRVERSGRHRFWRIEACA